MYFFTKFNTTEVLSYQNEKVLSVFSKFNTDAVDEFSKKIPKSGPHQLVIIQPGHEDHGDFPSFIIMPPIG